MRASRRRWLVAVAAIFGMGATVAALLVSLDALLMTMFGASPCVRIPFFEQNLLIVPGVIVVAGVLAVVGLIVRRRRVAIAGYAIAVGAALVWLVAWQANASAQTSCRARTLPEAFRACDADPKAWAVMRGRFDTTITLVAPVLVDRSYHCLKDWAAKQPGTYVGVDRGVHDAARRRSGMTD